jgi:deoxyribodipyrimidine photo-lyase
VCSNYGNWNAAAGLTGGRVNKFNISKQSRDYDPNGDYIRHWLPELKNVPAPLIFEPWKLSLGDQEKYNVKIGVDYPQPITNANNNINDGNSINSSGNNGYNNNNSRNNNRKSSNGSGSGDGNGNGNSNQKRGRRNSNSASKVQHY